MDTERTTEFLLDSLYLEFVEGGRRDQQGTTDGDKETPKATDWILQATKNCLSAGLNLHVHVNLRVSGHADHPHTTVGASRCLTSRV